jgi:hypothetical protein
MSTQSQEKQKNYYKDTSSPQPTSKPLLAHCLPGSEGNNKKELPNGAIECQGNFTD